jgi:hypothetical protein
VTITVIFDMVGKLFRNSYIYKSLRIHALPQTLPKKKIKKNESEGTKTIYLCTTKHEEQNING